MKKQRKTKYKIIDKYIILIFLTLAFVSIAYASITAEQLTVEGTAEVEAQTGVFITDIVSIGNVGADTASSGINYYLGTMFDSKVVLGSSSNSSITYQVTLYNSTEKEYVYIGTLTNEEDEALYSNTNITYSTNIEEYKTTIAPGGTLVLNITFKYAEGAETSQNTLQSKLNIRFKEKPIIDLKNEGETYTLENIYPGYTDEGYEFTVTDYTETEKNGVPLSYSFEIDMPEVPFEAKIYNGSEIVESITLEGNGQTSNTYTLKIEWDESKNSKEYANQTYTGKIILKAKPTDEKYINYEITKEFNIEIKTAPFYFNAEPEETEITASNNEASLGLTINNYNSSTEYNPYDTNYEITLEDTSKYTITVEDENNGVISSGAKENNVTVKFTPVEGADISEEEQVNLIIKSTKPYINTITKTITIKIGNTELINIQDLPAGTYINYQDNEGNIIPCIILYDTEYNEANGTNYGIQAITAEPVKYVTLGSDEDFEEVRSSYNSGIETLNNEAMAYLNTEYATDARCVGSNPADKTLEGEEKTFAELTGTDINFGTFKEGDENYQYDYNQINSLGLDDSEDSAEEYWLASRGVGFEVMEPYCYFYFMTKYWMDFNMDPLALIEVGDGEIVGAYPWGARECGLRPVFTMSNALQTNGGSGTAESPYNLIIGGYIPVSLVRISGNSEVAINNTIQLTAEVLPEDATEKTVTWASSNTSIAEVDENGLVTGKLAGIVTIIAEADGVKDTFQIRVIVPVESVTITGENTVGIDETIQLTAEVLPEDATEKTVTWTSSNTRIAEVDENGLVTGKSAGTVTITAEAGGKTATHEVTVEKELIYFTVNGTLYSVYAGTEWGRCYERLALLWLRFSFVWSGRVCE